MQHCKSASLLILLSRGISFLTEELTFHCAKWSGHTRPVSKNQNVADVQYFLDSPWWFLFLKKNSSKTVKQD